MVLVLMCSGFELDVCSCYFEFVVHFLLFWGFHFSCILFFFFLSTLIFPPDLLCDDPHVTCVLLTSPYLFVSSSASFCFSSSCSSSLIPQLLMGGGCICGTFLVLTLTCNLHPRLDRGVSWRRRRQNKHTHRARGLYSVKAPLKNEPTPGGEAVTVRACMWTVPASAHVYACVCEFELLNVTSEELVDLTSAVSVQVHLPCRDPCSYIPHCDESNWD